MKRNILVLYVARQYPLRVSQRDHLRSFARYADDARCFYVNVGVRRLPAFLRSIKFDLIVFHWSLLGARPARGWFRRMATRLDGLRGFSGIRVALPQDEFAHMDLLNEFINEFRVDVVFSVAPESEWPKLYPQVDRSRTRFARVLTGYLDDGTIARVERLAVGRKDARSIDIGYRVASYAFWGRFNQIKVRLAGLFERAGQRLGFVTDIAVGERHFLLGDDWLKFLLDCRFTIGVEGGSSILDWDGSLAARINAFRAQNPEADFESVESACIPRDRDGEVAVTALSPRHLEACLTRTGQILVEGDYNGILRSGEHYVPLQRDFGNLDAVLAVVSNESARVALTDAAYRDIVASGHYTYRSFVRTVLAAGSGEKGAGALRYALNVTLEGAAWVYIALLSLARSFR